MLKLLCKGMKKKKNNKGFSLVELIVVIAIMAILAIALAPRLTHYLDKARKSNDNQLIDTIANAVKLGIYDETVYNAVKTIYDEPIDLTTMCVAVVAGDTEYKFLADGSLDKLALEVKKVVGDEFSLQSDEASIGNDRIYIKVDSQYKYAVYLFYNTASVAVATLTDAYLQANADYFVLVD